MREALLASSKGGYAEPSGQTTGAYLADWLDGLRLAPSTVASYRKNVRLHAAWHTLASTGMRRGELLALRWRDIDLDAATITVWRSAGIVRNAGQGAVLDEGPTKTRAGVRVIDSTPPRWPSCGHGGASAAAWPWHWPATTRWRSATSKAATCTRSGSAAPGAATWPGAAPSWAPAPRR
jgi:hypothetical protein